jgi:FixJ family two-component response regulator
LDLSAGIVVVFVESFHIGETDMTAGMSKTPMISIVDDDEAVRNATKALIRSLGYRVATFASAEDFLKSDRLRETSCLISDVQMPGLNGLELQEHLTAAGHRIPTIFVTAFPDDRLRDRAMRSGAVSFMSKPFSEANLIVCLDRALQKMA